MPDGSNFTQSSNSSISPASEHALDPVTLGYVTGEEWTAVKRWAALQRSQTKKKKPIGPANFAALSGRTILHTWHGTSDARPIYRNSVRYWWLLAHFEKDWIEQRRPMPVLPHERAALALNKRGHDLRKAKTAFNEVSRFSLVLAKQCGSQRIIDRFEACPRDKRRKLLLDAWAKSRVALRRFFTAVERYKALRAAFDEAEHNGPSRLSKARSVKQPVPRPSFEPCWSEADGVRIADEQQAPGSVSNAGFRFAVVTLSRTPEQLMQASLLPPDNDGTEPAEVLSRLFMEAEAQIKGQLEIIKAAQARVLMCACHVHGVELPK